MIGKKPAVKRKREVFLLQHKGFLTGLLKNRMTPWASIAYY